MDAWTGDALIETRIVVLFFRSLGMAAAVALVSFSIAIPLATVFQSRGDACHRRLSGLRWLLVSIILIPPYIHALAWMDFLGRLSAFARTFGRNWTVQGDLISTWVWVMALLPCAVGVSILVLESVQPDLFQAARLVRDDLTAFLRIILPLAAPSLLVGAGFVMLICLLDYSVASLFGVSVYALEIFADYSATGNVGRALALSLPLLLAALFWILVSIKYLRPGQQTPALYPVPEGQVLRWPSAWSWIQNLALLLVFFQALVPVLVLLVRTGSWQAFLSAYQGSRAELWYSLRIVALTLLGVLPLGVLLSAGLHGSGRMARWLWAGILIPFLTPAPLVGILLVQLRNLVPSLGSSGAILPVMAGCIRFAPLAAVVLTVQRSRINPAYIEAARILEGSPLRRSWSVVLPLLKPGILVAAGLAAALSLGELGATLMVTPPGRSTLAVKIYNYLHYGASDQVASLCLLVTFLAAAVIGLCFWMVRAAGTRSGGPA